MHLKKDFLVIETQYQNKKKKKSWLSKLEATYDPTYGLYVVHM